MKLTDIHKEIENFLGDKRTNYYSIFFDEKNNIVYATLGDNEVGEKLNKHILDKNYGIKVIIKIAGGDIPDSMRYVQTIVPVADVRAEPKFRSERVHQTIFGEWAKVLGFNGDYLFIQEEKNGYLGYALKRSFEFADFEEKIQIQKLEQYFIISRFAFLSNEIRGGNTNILNGWYPLGSKLSVLHEDQSNLFIKIPGSDLKVAKKDCLNTEDTKAFSKEKIIESYLRVPYLWGGCSVYGTDCSGFVGKIYELSGKIIPRDADQQKNFCIPLKKEELSKYDLVFFPGHVGIYLDGGIIVHSNLGLGGVTFSNIFEPKTSYEEYLCRTISGFGKVPV